jgi:hypothetical protein
MTDAGGASKDIDQQEGEKCSGENPRKNADGLYFQKECSRRGRGDHQCQNDTPGGPPSCSPGNDRLNVGEVKTFVILGETIAIHTQDMVIPQVE